MCVAIAGKVISVEGKRAKVDYRGNVLDVNIGIITPKPGDFCLVHAGCAIEIIDNDQAKEIDDVISMIEEGLKD